MLQNIVNYKYFIGTPRTLTPRHLLPGWSIRHLLQAMVQQLLGHARHHRLVAVQMQTESRRGHGAALPGDVADGHHLFRLLHGATARLNL